MSDKSHWSFDDRAARVQRRNNRPKERTWRREFRGLPPNRPAVIGQLMKQYSCDESVAARVLELLRQS